MVIEEGGRYEVHRDGATHKLYIQKVEVADSGLYTCDTGDEQSTIELSVRGKQERRIKNITFSDLPMRDARLFKPKQTELILSAGQHLMHHTHSLFTSNVL